ncbi:MAG: hypothetical protein JW776_09150 [Candidatus Lokiarchaeota archaeon]|nr:hypothetical protein [Candidatus Lokiarchaeota archaeon]
MKILLCSLFLLLIFLLPSFGKSTKHPTTIEFESRAVGYRINAHQEIMVQYDDNAYIELCREKSVQIHVSSIFGEYLCDELVIEEETVAKRDKYHRFEIENIKNGFFMEISIDNEFSYFSIAYDSNGSQFIFEGLLCDGLDEFFNGAKREYTEEDLTKINEGFTILQKEQEQNLKISVSEKYESSTKSYPITYTKYGVVHLPYDLDQDHGSSSSHYVDDVCNDYLEPESGVDIGIYRYLPTEATIKSDLSYYNKDYYFDTGYVNDILAYLIVTENTEISNHNWKIWKWRWLFGWYQDVDSILTASEIEDLWYTIDDPDWGDPDTYIYPEDTIVVAHMCYSWGTDIADAFIDDGANAFMGSNGIAYSYSPEVTDDPARVFWEELCDNDANIEDARDDYVAELENEIPSGTHIWLIRGNQYATLEN